MLKDRIIFLDGDFVLWDQATVHMMSHSFSRGSAIFEVLSIHDTRLGTAVFRLDEHISRFFESARLLEMEIPLKPAELQEKVLETVRRNNIQSGLIKIMGFYPQIAFAILPPQKELSLAIFAIDLSRDVGGVAFSSEVSLCLSKWTKLDPTTVPIEAKIAANYLNGMMARQEAVSRGFDQAVMLDTQGFLAEGGTESIFLVKEGVLMTPSEGTVLKGISRKSVLQVARHLDVKVFEGRIPRETLHDAEEIFLASTPMKVQPVDRVEDKSLPNAPGQITRRLSESLQGIVDGKNEHFKDWLFPVN